MKLTEFLKRCGMGALIGVAVIIPGVSGGTVAVILNIYDRLIESVSGLRKHFKDSFLFLAPVLLGVALAFAAMYFPLRFFLKVAPFPTVMLFAGLMLGTLPKIVKEGANRGFKPLNALSVILPLAVVIGVCFIPNLGDCNLGTDMAWYGYFLLVLVGALASCALVVPGVSGSMLLLILGYYQPVLDTISALKLEFLHSAAVLLLFAVGLVIGFFSIAKLMKFFLNKLPRGTYWAIIGFVFGSLPAIFITFPGNFPESLPLELSHIIVGALLCAFGAVATFALTSYAEKKRKSDADIN